MWFRNKRTGLTWETHNEDLIIGLKKDIEYEVVDGPENDADIDINTKAGDEGDSKTDAKKTAAEELAALRAGALELNIEGAEKMNRAQLAKLIEEAKSPKE